MSSLTCPICTTTFPRSVKDCKSCGWRISGGIVLGNIPVQEALSYPQQLEDARRKWHAKNLIQQAATAIKQEQSDAELITNSSTLPVLSGQSSPNNGHWSQALTLDVKKRTWVDLPSRDQLVSAIGNLRTTTLGRGNQDANGEVSSCSE